MSSQVLFTPARLVRKTMTGTIGTSAVSLLTLTKDFSYIRVINPTQGNILAVTYDGVTVPVIGSVGVQLGPWGTDEQYFVIPVGSIKAIANAASTPFEIEYS